MCGVKAGGQGGGVVPLRWWWEGEGVRCKVELGMSLGGDQVVEVRWRRRVTGGGG